MEGELNRSSYFYLQNSEQYSIPVVCLKWIWQVTFGYKDKTDNRDNKHVSQKAFIKYKITWREKILKPVMEPDFNSSSHMH